MGRYSYKLHRDQDKQVVGQNTYRYSQLEKMTTFQLRDICMKEKIVKNILDPLNREELIRLIMRFRGVGEVVYIDTYIKGGLERIEDFLQSTKIIERNELPIEIPTKFTIYEDMEISYFDRYQVKSQESLALGNILLVDDHYNVQTILQLRETQKAAYYITKSKEVLVKDVSKKQYSMVYMGKKESDLLYDIYYGKNPITPAYFELQKLPIVEFNLNTIGHTENPLVIDFGTSNTTAGIFDGSKDLHIVSVLKQEEGIWKEMPLIPSVIGIKKITGDKLEYAFGNDAIEMFDTNYLDEDTPIFYDIKRWVNDGERKEKVITPDGRSTWVKRKVLLAAYLGYIIETAVQRFKMKFKKIALLSPVRQKGKFGQLFKELLAGYQVECELNEGVAVLFENIGKLLEHNNYEKNFWYKAMVIDCGGGTTDLTSCKFKIDNNRVSYHIDMECSYENGDTNFGGNNLTYRIMQLLKIRIVEMLENRELFLMKALQGFYLNDFRYVDEQGKEPVYERLEAAYQEAEEILPTQFKNYEDKGAEYYFKVKNNYYYLFNIAEKMKKKFFLNEDIFQLDIGWEKGTCIKASCEQLILDRWKLSFRCGQKFYNAGGSEQISFYLYEIQALLSADVYSLMKKFLESSYDKGVLSQYNIIKLTGQSCQSGLFVETLKEFIPGKVIQSMRKQKESYDLKLCCQKGALLYYQNKKLGLMEINHTYETEALPYEVMAYTHEDREKILIHCLQKVERTGHISRFIEGEQICLYLKNGEGKILKSYLYEYKPEELKATTYGDIAKEIGNKILQEETDNIVNGESKFFVWASKEEWGFYVLPVIRKTEQLHMGKKLFYDFEDDTWEQNFFDGLK